MAVGAGSIKRASKVSTEVAEEKTAAKKTPTKTTTSKTTAKKTTASKAAATEAPKSAEKTAPVKEVQAVKKSNEFVRLTQEMPVHLL